MRQCTPKSIVVPLGPEPGTLLPSPVREYGEENLENPLSSHFSMRIREEFSDSFDGMICSVRIKRVLHIIMKRCNRTHNDSQK